MECYYLKSKSSLGVILDNYKHIKNELWNFNRYQTVINSELKNKQAWKDSDNYDLLSLAIVLSFKHSFICILSNCNTPNQFHLYCF